MPGKPSLLLSLVVNRLLPRPQLAAVSIGLFRVSCIAAAGNMVSDQTFTVANGGTVVRAQPCSTLVIRTNRPLTVQLTTGVDVRSMVVDQLLAVTTPVDAVSLTYNDPGADPLDLAQVSLIQA